MNLPAWVGALATIGGALGFVLGVWRFVIRPLSRLEAAVPTFFAITQNFPAGSLKQRLEAVEAGVKTNNDQLREIIRLLNNNGMH